MPSGGGGAASSMFSSRNSNKFVKYENVNRDMTNMFDDDYDPNNLKSTRLIPNEQLLLGRLLRNYDPASRPVYNAAKTVVVRFGLLFIQICDLVGSKLVYV
jgi:hypothetical protein